MVKNLPAMWETQLPSLGCEDPLEEGMATHSSILPWRIPRQRSLVRYSPWGLKESDTTELLTLPRLHYFQYEQNQFLNMQIVIYTDVDFCVLR